MVDLQTHVLPGLDDGAADEATAIEICRTALRAGTRELVATPDCDPKFGFDRADVDAKAAALEQKVGGELKIHTGAVLQLSHDTFADVITDLSRYSINSRRYVLVKPTGSAVARGVAKLFGAIRDVGYRTILAQPETSGPIRDDLQRVRRWIKGGTLVAVGTNSLFGYNGARAEESALALLDAELAHFVVSDARSTGRRNPALDDAYNFAVYRWGEDRARKLFIDHPWSVLWGERIETPRPRKLEQSFSLARAVGWGVRR